MGKSFGPEFRRRVIQRVGDGHAVTVVAELGVSEPTVFRWVLQDRIDRGERVGMSSREKIELADAHRRIREPGTELAVVKKAAEVFAIERIRPKGSSQ